MNKSYPMNKLNRVIYGESIYDKFETHGFATILERIDGQRDPEQNIYTSLFLHNIFDGATRLGLKTPNRRLLTR